MNDVSRGCIWCDASSTSDKRSKYKVTMISLFNFDCHLAILSGLFCDRI